MNRARGRLNSGGSARGRPAALPAAKPFFATRSHTSDSATETIAHPARPPLAAAGCPRRLASKVSGRPARGRSRPEPPSGGCQRYRTQIGEPSAVSRFPLTTSADRNDRTPESPDHGRGDRRRFRAPQPLRRLQSRRGDARVPGSAGKLEDVHVSHGGVVVCSTDTFTCRLVGPAAQCRWPWTLTARPVPSTAVCGSAPAADRWRTTRSGRSCASQLDAAPRRDVAVVVPENQDPLARARP